MEASSTSDSLTPHSRALFVAALVSLFSLALVTFLGKSYETTLRGIDSNIHASVAMSVTSKPGSLLPLLPTPIKNFSAASPASGPSTGLNPDRYFNDHQFPGFWLNGLVMRAFGPSSWSARLLTALFSVGCVVLVFLMGWRYRSRAFGVVAALFLTFSRDFILTSATMSLDTVLAFFILLTFYLWQRGRWLGLGLAAGAGLWMKTPIVLLVFPVGVVTEALLGKLKPHLMKWIASLTLALVLGVAFWTYVGLAGGWDLVIDYWHRQLWGTVVGGRSVGQGTQWGFFWYYVRTGFLPGLPLLILALALITRRKLWRRPEYLSSGLAVLVLCAVVTAIRYKLGHFVNPVFPFLAILAAESVAGWCERNESLFYAGLNSVVVAAAAVLVTSPISLGPEPFVAMKRFVPFISTTGTCDDTIAILQGGEPVGSELDYRVYLGFYTGRTVEVYGCADLKSRSESGHLPRWVILSHENWLNCVAEDSRAKFPFKLRVGTQLLLGSQEQPIPDAAHSKGVVDLTPLELEGKAVTDCKAPPYPRDMWHRYLFD